MRSQMKRPPQKLNILQAEIIFILHASLRFQSRSPKAEKRMMKKLSNYKGSNLDQVVTQNTIL